MAGTASAPHVSHLLVANPTAQSGKNAARIERDGNPVTEEILNAVGIAHSKPFRAAKITLDFTLPRDVAHAAQIDGEEWVASPRVAIDVVARAIRLIVPAGSPVPAQ